MLRKTAEKNYMRTGAPATKNPDKTILEQMLRKTTEKKIYEKDAQKNPRKKTIREQQMHPKNPRKKNYMRTDAPTKNQRKRYKHSVRR